MLKELKENSENLVLLKEPYFLSFRAFIDFLVENGTPLSNFHLMGHSAGTHLAGGAGAAVTKGRVPRITGIN